MKQLIQSTMAAKMAAIVLFQKRLVNLGVFDRLMRPKLGHISWMLLFQSSHRNPRQVVGNYYEEGCEQKLGQVGPTFLKRLPPKLGGSECGTSSHHGTKLKSLAKMAKLLTEAGLLTCGQLGHKLKNGAQVDHHFRWLKDNSVQFELN